MIYQMAKAIPFYANYLEMKLKGFCHWKSLFDMNVHLLKSSSKSNLQYAKNGFYQNLFHFKYFIFIASMFFFGKKKSQSQFTFFLTSTIHPPPHEGCYFFKLIFMHSEL